MRTTGTQWFWEVNATLGLRVVYHHAVAALFAVAVGVLVISSGGQAAPLPYTYIETAVLPELSKASGFAVCPPASPGDVWRMAAVRDGRVFLYEISDQTKAAYQEITGFPSAAVSVDFADYDGDGQKDLWIGSAGSGNIYVYGLGEGYPLLGKSADRVWAKVVQIYTPDLDGDHFADALALTENGTVYAFVQRSNGLEQVGSTGVREGKVAHLSVGDLNGDGRDEVAMARDGYATVWSWAPTPQPQDSLAELANQLPAPQLGVAAAMPTGGKQVTAPEPSKASGRFARTWEFDSPKGAIQNVVIADTNLDNAKELIVTTAQSRLYVFAADAAGNIALRSDSDVATLTTGLRGALPGDRGGALLFATIGDGFGIWQHKGGSAWSYELVWQSEFDLRFSRLLPAGEWLLVAGSDGMHILKRVPRSYIQVTVGDKQYTDLLADPVVVRGEVLLAAKDWSNMLHLAPPAWNSAGRLTLMHGLQYLIATLGSKEVVVNGRAVNVRYEPRNVDGLVFLPSEAVNLITGNISWQPRTRSLVVP